MEKVTVFTAGKINLSLNILGKRGQMHLIDSVMVSINIGDTVTVWPRSDNKINIIFTGFSDSGFDELSTNNTVKKTSDYLRARYGDFGALITVQKNLPIAYGLGGSAADSAAALTALNRLFCFDKCGMDIFAAGADLGSDVPFMLTGGCARVGGTGEILTPVENNLSLNIVLASRGINCSSKDAYARFDQLNPDCTDLSQTNRIQTEFFKTEKSQIKSLSQNNSQKILCDNGRLIDLLKEGNPAALKLFANALAPASESLCGGIENTKALLLKHGAINAVMTGSGSAVAGFFDCPAAAEKAAVKISGLGLYAKACVSTKVGTKIL